MGSIEERMAKLESIGIHILPPYTLEDICQEFPDFIGEGYKGLLHVLGYPDYESTEADEVPRCNALYSFDTECIEMNEGEYISKIEALCKLTAGDLEVTEASDSFSGWEDGEPLHVTIDFKCNGLPVHWEFDQTDDYFQPHVLDKLELLLKQSGSSRRFFALEGDGQVAEVGCLLEDQVKELEKLVGTKLL